MRKSGINPELETRNPKHFYNAINKEFTCLG